MLSNPGQKSDDGAKDAPNCDEASGDVPGPTEPAPQTPVVTEAVVVTEASVETSAIKTKTEAPTVTVAQVQTEAPETTAFASTATDATPDEAESIYSASCSPYNAPCSDDSSCCGMSFMLLFAAPFRLAFATLYLSLCCIFSDLGLKSFDSLFLCTKDSSDQCTPAPWEGADTMLCLPRPPVCYNANERCAGADGYEFVPYAGCCDKEQDCVENKEMGWGRFCVARTADPYY